MTKEFYTYCLLKYKHSPYLDESINVGVLIYFSTSGRFAFKYSKNLSRIKNIYAKVPEKTIKEYLRQIERALNKYAANINLFPLNDTNLKEFLSKNILPHDGSILQFGHFRTEVDRGFENSIIEASIFDSFFIEDLKTTTNTQQEPQIIANLNKELRKRGIESLANSSRYQRDYLLKTDTGNFNFDFAWKNGVWNLVKPVGFDLKSSDRILSKARNNLGEFTDLYSELGDQKGGYKTNLLVGRPTDRKFFTSYDKALAILAKSPNTEVFEEDSLQTYSEKVMKAITKK